MKNNFWLGRSVLVTGASGLLGSALTRSLLERGADVVCLIRDTVPNSELVRSNLIEKVKVVRGDICDQKLMERIIGEHEVDTVMHLAAQAIVGTANLNPISTFEANIQGTWNLLEACRRTPRAKQIIIASSDKAYGDQEILPYKEDTPLQGRHPYDVSKSCADLIAYSYAYTYDMPIVVTRCGNFYGGGDLNWNRIVPGTIKSLIQGEQPTIRSNGKFIRDYLYVLDGAEAYILLAEKLETMPELKGHSFNISNQEPITVIELVKKILKIMNSDQEPLILNQASNEIVEQYLDATKASKLLGWKPHYSLDDGLNETIAWYRNFFSK